MKRVKEIPTWAIIVGLLLLADMSLMSYNVYQHATLRAAVKQFRFEVLHTNNMSGIGLFRAKTDQAIWTQFSENNAPVIENYFFLGNDLFDVVFRSNRPPVYNVYFRGPGKSMTWWLNANGANTFTEKISYDADGRLSRSEILYDQAWHTVVRRNDKNGILVNGQWRQLRFDTNRMWAIEAPTNTP